MRILLGTVKYLTAFLIVFVLVCFPHHWPWLLIPFFLNTLYIFAILHPRCDWICSPLKSRFETAKKEVWITIDDGPVAGETPQILDVLEQHNATVTFFVIGKRLAANPELVQEIVDRGHSLGNHTWSHPRSTFWIQTKGQIEREIRLCSEKIEEVIGEKPKHFRAPVGHKPWHLRPTLEKEKLLPLISWSASARDGIRFDKEKSLRLLLNDLQPGAILVLHEGLGHGPELLEALLVELEKRGYSSRNARGIDSAT